MKKSRFLSLLLLVGLLTISSCTSTKKKSKKTSSKISSITSTEVGSSETPSSNPISVSSSSASTSPSSNTSKPSSSTSSSSPSVTPPPEDDYEEIKTLTKRMPAEFEPCEQVIMCYPAKMSADAYKEIAKDNQVLLLCHPNGNTSRISQAQNWVSSNQMNAENFTYLDMNLDDDYQYWARDFSPFFVYNNLDLGVVDFTYNRPQRTEQNKVPSQLSTFLNMSYSKMNLTHTGGNLMQNGRGTAFSDDLVIDENNNNETKVRSEMLEYTGTDNYVITIDSQGEYIAHVDCWAKIVAPDKIIVAKLPQSNSRYQYYEQVASELANTKCSYGYNYKIYRIEEPGGDILAPYTNSLIANKHVYLPLGENESYNQKAIQVYEEALPGYTIHGIENVNQNYIAFENTDALHCRTHEIPSSKNVFIDSREVLHGDISISSKLLVKCNVVSYDKQSLKSVKLYYSINDGAYQSVDMSQYKETSNYTFEFTSLSVNDSVKYYIEAEDTGGTKNADPVFKQMDPHSFSVI